MILNIHILRSGVKQVVFINECKYCEISNQMFFNVMFSFLKTKGKMVMTQILPFRMVHLINERRI